jgi:HEAT repeat protein
MKPPMRKLAGAPDVIAVLKHTLTDTTYGHFDRAAAGRLLGPDIAVPELLRLFLAQEEQDELYVTALAIEGCANHTAIPPLIEALLNDPNPHRRHAAARALGWIRKSQRSAARALAQSLADPEQPHAAREEAAESLAYVGTRESVGAMVNATRDPDVRIRFWATFALGGRVHNDPRAIQALESLLTDNEAPPGNWWSVGREALAMSGDQQRLAAEIAKVLADPSASAGDRRWAEFYSP